MLGDTFSGALIGKSGADACYAIAVRGSPETRKLGASGALGVAVKIEDDSIEALYSEVCALLAMFGLTRRLRHFIFQICAT